MLSRMLTLSLLLAANAGAADDALVRAMKDELGRSMKKLQLENLQKPYFIAYRVIDGEFCSASASFGAITGSACDPGGEKQPRSRQLSVEVRVGDYDRDNSNYYAMRQNASGVIRFTSNGQEMPIGDNYDEFRRQLWLATDGAYKAALDSYAQKKAALENRTRTDVAADFSKEQPVTDSEEAPWTRATREQLEAMVRPLSALFRQAPDIDNSEVRIRISNWLTRYVNSEGTSFSRQNSSVQLAAIADTQAVDGLPVTDFESFFGRSLQDLPSKDIVTQRIHDLQARISELRKAPLVEKYTGPVLFEGQAAAELLVQGLGSAILGIPRVVVDDVRFEGVFGSNRGSLTDKMGGRVLPEFLTLKDDATAREFARQPLLGGYQVDEDGVKAQPTMVIDHGILKTLLHTRGLIVGTTASTASKRGTGPAPSNLLLTSEKSVPADQLKAELIRLIKQRNKEYGVLVRRMANQMMAPTLGRSRTVIITSGSDGLNLEPLTVAYKVYPDGREELARNLTIQGMTLATFKEILAVSDQPVVYTSPFVSRRSAPIISGFYSPGLPTLVSIVTPSLLFDELTLQRPSGEVPNLPFTRHPYFEGK